MIVTVDVIAPVAVAALVIGNDAVMVIGPVNPLRNNSPRAPITPACSIFKSWTFTNALSSSSR